MTAKHQQQRNKEGGTGLSREEGKARLKKGKEELPHGDSGGLHNPKKGTIDYKELAKSNRPLHHQALGAGKGSDRRPPSVDDKTLTENWCETFGHKWVEWLPTCANGCGTKKGKPK